MPLPLEKFVGLWRRMKMYTMAASLNKKRSLGKVPTNVEPYSMMSLHTGFPVVFPDYTKNRTVSDLLTGTPDLQG